MTNFDLYVQGTKRCKKKKQIRTDENFPTFYPCIYCKGVFAKDYLRRHVKICKVSNENTKVNNCVAKSQTLAACHMDVTNTVSKLFVKEKVSAFFGMIIKLIHFVFAYNLAIEI